MMDVMVVVVGATTAAVVMEMKVINNRSDNER